MDDKLVLRNNLKEARAEKKTVAISVGRDGRGIKKYNKFYRNGSV